MESPRLRTRSSVATEEVVRRERVPPYVRSGIYPPRPYQLSPYYYRNIFTWFIPFIAIAILIAYVSRMNGLSFHSESTTLEHGLRDTKQMSTIPISDLGNHLPSTDRFPHSSKGRWTDVNLNAFGLFDWVKSWVFSGPSKAEILHAKETFDKVISEPNVQAEAESKAKVEEVNRAKTAFEKIETEFQPYSAVVHSTELQDITEIRKENDGIHIIHTYVREVILSPDQYEKNSAEYDKVIDKIAEEKEKVKRKAEELGSELKETVEEKVQEAGDSIKDIKERMEDFGEMVKEKIAEGAEKLKETRDDIKDSLKEKISEVKDRVEEGAEIVKERAEEVGEKIKERVIEGSEIVREKVEEGSDLLKEKLAEGAEKLKEARDDIKERVIEGSEIVKEKISEGAEMVKEKAEEVGEKIREKVMEGGEKVYNQAEDLKGVLKGKVLEMKDNTKEDLWYVSEAVKQRARALFADWDIQEKIEQWKAEEVRLRREPYVNLPPSSTERPPSRRPLPTVQPTPDFTFTEAQQPLSREQLEYYQNVMDVHLPAEPRRGDTYLREKIHESYHDAKNKVDDFAEGVKMRAEDRWEHVKDAGKELSNEAKNAFERVEKIGEQIKDNIEGKVREGYEHAKDEVRNFGEEVKIRAEDRWEHVKDAGKELKHKAEQASEDLKDNLHNSKDGMGHEYEDSLKSTWNEIKDVLDKAKDVSKRGYERAIDRSQRDQFGNKVY
eukprot:TRINITY_DN2752_c0_g1_i1.p1 TRINITY_DN2752_c0_g1~~TRINITY_DN2752_c0_g1_i1.p1  ORF type:complete len:722 (-),score=197.35 TRINITY_DN2752_c0_g1_i1:108-2273(-)